MSEALQNLSDLAQDGKESRAVLAVLRDHETRLVALETTAIDAAEASTADTAQEA